MAAKAKSQREKRYQPSVANGSNMCEKKAQWHQMKAM